MIDVHRVIGRVRRVRGMRIQMEHPQEEPLVTTPIDERQRVVDRLGAEHPGDRVRLPAALRLVEPHAVG
ncbi:MAG: hypothetical protein ACYS15_21000, partial [Planctomycetota bacterium]